VGEIDLARSIFKAWDLQEKGYLTLQEITEQLITLRLSTQVDFVKRLLQNIKAKKIKKVFNEVTGVMESPSRNNMKSKVAGRAIEEPSVSIEVMTLKHFLKVFEFDRFGDKLCQVIKEEF